MYHPLYEKNYRIRWFKKFKISKCFTFQNIYLFGFPIETINNLFYKFKDRHHLSFHLVYPPVPGPMFFVSLPFFGSISVSFAKIIKSDI